MAQLKLSILAFAAALGCAASAHAKDILSTLSNTPARPAPTTIPYSYTLSIDFTAIDGKDTEVGQAVLRIDPSQPAGSRAQILSATDPESETLADFLKDIEDPDNTMKKRADKFWCGTLGGEDHFDPADFELVSETPTEAILRPRENKLAELMMQTDGTPADKKERKMKKKLMERIDGQVTLSKPTAQMKEFQVTMTRPLTMMVVAKLKTMDVEQSCALAPNGFYHFSEMKMNVEGKAMGSRFGQNMTLRVTDLSPLP
jgi:hypothetical protein